ncbi:Integrase zinc binding domain [Popillia japonica]|uniref:Integrase zinc binding domain n=1 Tax=Popillia japonica TaxID=7064 RepID=A0AAW1LAE6_POPJA
MQVEVIRSAHERGHFACRKTRELIEQDYFIPGLQSKVERFITNCVPCIMVNRKAGKKEGYLQAIFKEAVPLHTYHLDHLGPLETTAKSYKHILAVIDGFTKFVWLYPAKTNSTRETLRVRMKTKKDEHIRQLINEEQIEMFMEDRRKDPARYEVGDLVAIKRTQQGPGLKLRAHYLDPYQVTKVKPYNSYDVIKEGDHYGPTKSTSTAEYLKRWTVSNTGSSGGEKEEPKDRDTDVDKVSGSVTTRTAECTQVAD